jgi:hypothetical protein
MINPDESLITIRVDAGKLSGWFTIDIENQIVRCSQRYDWALHLNSEKLLNWIKKKTQVKTRTI